MNKYTILAGAVLLFAACSTADGIDEAVNAPAAGDNTLTALLETETRTYLQKLENGVYRNFWSEDERISVFVDDSETATVYRLVDGAHTASATFSGYGTGGRYTAVYPCNDYFVSRDGNLLRIELPYYQSYREGSFYDNAFPMIAESDGSTLLFKNLCAVLKVPLTGTVGIESIKVSANDAETAMSGILVVELNGGGIPEPMMEPDGSNSVYLGCDGVVLDPEVPTEFHIVVPAQLYKGGFTVTVTSMTGVAEKVIGSDVEMHRSEMRALKPFNVDEVFDGILPSRSLNGDGTIANPFVISSLPDLLLMQSAVNGSGSITSSESGAATEAATAVYMLADDIDLAEWNNRLGSWVPIGRQNHPFSGTLRGESHTIDNLYIAGSDELYCGLFGFCLNATVNGLTVRGAVSASDYAALLCGYAESSLLYACDTYGEVSGGAMISGGMVANSYGCTIRNCVNYAEILTDSQRTGGIVGMSEWDEIMGSFNYGSVYSSNPYVGGIAGSARSSYIGDCGNDDAAITGGATYVGGIVGFAQPSTVENCYNNSDIVGYKAVGGIAGGFMAQYVNAIDAATMNNCVNVGNVSDLSGAGLEGGICGYAAAYFNYCYWRKTAGMEGIYDYGGYCNMRQCFGLDDDAFYPDAATPYTLYGNSDGLYTHLDKALNGWAYDNGVYYHYGWTLEGGRPGFINEPYRPTPDKTGSVSKLVFRHTNSLQYALPSFVSLGSADFGVNWGGDELMGGSDFGWYDSTNEHTVEIEVHNAESVMFDNLTGITVIDLSSF